MKDNEGRIAGLYIKLDSHLNAEDYDKAHNVLSLIDQLKCRDCIDKDNA